MKYISEYFKAVSSIHKVVFRFKHVSWAGKPQSTRENKLWRIQRYPASERIIWIFKAIQDLFDQIILLMTSEPLTCLCINYFITTLFLIVHLFFLRLKVPQGRHCLLYSLYLIQPLRPPRIWWPFLSGSRRHWVLYNETLQPILQGFLFLQGLVKITCSIRCDLKQKP